MVSFDIMRGMKRMKKTLFCVIVGYVMMLFHVQSGLCFSLVEGGSSRAVILLGDNATLVEEHAAAELTKYVKMLSGAELEVVKKPEAVRKTDVILIGRKETNPKIASLADKGLIRLSSDYPGLDGFIIKTVSMDGKNFLVIGGSEDRGTLYAVYHFLEKYAGVGFFWEGDRVPAGRDRLSVARIAVAEKPRFSSRVYMQECPFAYSTRTWDINDWIKEIDWAAKKRLNALMVPEDNWNFRVSRDEIVKEVKKRGIKPVLLGEVARFDLVTQDFMAKNPKNNYVRMRWCSDPPYYALHPGDPLFMTRGREVIKRLVQKYGSGNIYFLSPYGEQQIMDLPDDKVTEIRLKFAESVWKIIRAEDPDGVWMFWTWPFITPPWPQDDVKQFLQRVPLDSAFVCDSSQPEIPGDYHYKRFNGFEGRNWILSIIGLYGGDDYLGGNISALVRDIKSIAVDREAGNCRGIYICPEIIHYNPLYFDLLAKLSWNPLAVDTGEYLKEYAIKRYGKESYTNMKKALDRLVKAVHGDMNGSEALYQHRLSSSGFLAIYLTNMAKQVNSFLPAQTVALKEALTFALSEKEKQAGNPYYIRDLVDISRQYITSLFNRHFQELNLRYAAKDLPGFKQEAAHLQVLMDSLEDILATYPPYQIKGELVKLQRTQDFASHEIAIKDSMLTFAGKEWLIDYPSKDIFELVKYYYRPRVDLYLRTMKASLTTGKAVDDQVLVAGYKKIEGDWLKTPLLSLKGDLYSSESTVSAIAAAIEDITVKEKAFSQRKAIAASDIIDLNKRVKFKSVLWQEDFSDVSDWKRTHYTGGGLVSDGKTATLSCKGGTVVYGTELNVQPLKHPLLAFTFRQSSETRRGAADFVVWLTWEDTSGIIWRNRIFQHEVIPYNEWVNVSLDLKNILSTLSIPKSLKMIEIEGLGSVTEWDDIRLGEKQ